MNKQGIWKIANSTSEFKNNVVEAFLKGVIPYDEVIQWSKKF